MIRVINVHFDDFIVRWHNPLLQVRNHFFVAVTEGRLHYTLNGTSRDAEKGDLLLIPAGTLREAWNVEGAPHRKYAAAFVCEGDAGLPLLRSREPVFIRTPHIEAYRRRFAAMRREAVGRRPYAEQLLQGLLLEALASACREREEPAQPKRRAQQVERLQAHILEHYRRPLPLRELAEAIGRSPNYTLALFREATGRTPLEYQHALRASAAAELLRHTNATVATIAEHLGYCDASSFYKAFKRHTGMSPAECRSG